MTTIEKQYISKLRDILYARRNRNIKREQVCYDRLTLFCEKHNLNGSTSWDNGIKWLKKNSLSYYMNGLDRA